MNETPDVTPDQISELLVPGLSGSYFRPYASNTIEVSFLTAMPLYEGILASYNNNFEKGSDGKPIFTAFTPPEQLRIRAAFVPRVKSCRGSGLAIEHAQTGIA